jgi:hypothetical protein
MSKILFAPSANAQTNGHPLTLDLRIDDESWSDSSGGYEEASGLGARVFPELAHEPLTDAVITLREWGTQRALFLRSHRARLASTTSTSEATMFRGSLTVGTARAELVYEQGSWWLRDLAGDCALRLDGRPVHEIHLMAGMEIGIGGRTLVVESPRSIALRNFLARLLGWDEERCSAIDHAMRAIGQARAGRATLVLSGSGDLVPIAQTLHRRSLGPTAPFILNDPRRDDGRETARSPANCISGVAALERARGGTLCLRAGRLPVDIDVVLDAVRKPGSDVMLVVCARAGMKASKPYTVTTTPIDIPVLASRRHEVPRIVAENIEEVIGLLQAPARCMRPSDLAWIVKLAEFGGDTTMADVERAVVRIVALRKTGNVTRAAQLLGMAPVSLARWFWRRKLRRR